MQINPAALAAIRERSGLSQAGLARESGVAQSHISAIEGGRRKGGRQAANALAEALKVPVTAILADPNGAEAQATAS